MADCLSKEALTLSQGQLQCVEFTYGERIEHGTFYLFYPFAHALIVLVSYDILWMMIVLCHLYI